MEMADNFGLWLCGHMICSYPLAYLVVSTVGLCIRLVTANVRCEGWREIFSEISNIGEVK